MLGFLFILINTTAIAVPITSIPFIYTTSLGGCANFSAYLDPLTPWGIASVYAISNNGVLTQPTLDHYPTPKYLRGRICGDFVTVKVDRWRSLAPLVPISIKGEDSAYLYQGVPYVINGTAVIKIKSFTPPLVEGRYVYKVGSTSAFGVYIEKYIVYDTAQVLAYGIANITYISLSDDKPDYYVEIPTRGVKIEGVKPWAPDFQLYFAPNQTTVVGRPRLVVEQIKIPVLGECRGVATVVNPLERPLRVYVKLETGEEYALSFYYLPDNITTWRLREVVARTIDGQNLPVYLVTTDDGASVGLCVVEGVSYFVYVKTNSTIYRYPAEVKNGVVEAFTDLVKPRVIAPGFNATVEPDVVKTGSNVTVRLYYNGTFVAEFIKKASPIIVINVSSLFHKIKVVDALGSPLTTFTIYVGSLKFYGHNGVAEIIPVEERAAVEINGVRYLAQIQPEIKVPTLTQESFLKIAAAATTVGVATAFALRRKEPRATREKIERDVVEV